MKDFRAPFPHNIFAKKTSGSKSCFILPYLLFGSDTINASHEISLFLQISHSEMRNICALWFVDCGI